MPRPRSQNLGHSVDAGLALRRVGGHPALDFANTVDLDRPQPETLTDYRSLVAWCEGSGLCTNAEARRLSATAKTDPGTASRLHRQAIELRDIAGRLCAARVLGRPASSGALEALNGLLSEYAVSLELMPSDLGCVRGHARGESELADPLRRLLWLIAGFLTSPDFAKVSRCAGEGCGWFFIDRTPTRRRRWCSMQGCGNRAKAHAHYQRHKKTTRSSKTRHRES